MRRQLLARAVQHDPHRTFALAKDGADLPHRATLRIEQPERAARFRRQQPRRDVPDIGIGELARLIDRCLGLARQTIQLVVGGGRQLPPETIEACVLSALGKDIARQFTDYRAVITVPAFFDERRRGLTLAAGRIAGLQVLDIVNEPTAAALAFGEQLGYLTSDGTPRDSLTLMVYDLGGGTFDVTIIQIVPGEVRTLSTDGDVTLGGLDWDRRLLDYVAQKFEDEQRIDFRDDSAACAKVLQSCEEAKHTLTAQILRYP